MSDTTRRQFAQHCLLTATAWSMAPSILAAEERAAPGVGGLPRLGKIVPRASRAIASSPLSVGFETLDRQHFDAEKTYPHVAELGVKWARCQTGWARTEREKGSYDFVWLDGVVDSLRRRGVQPWFNLGYGNPLYTPQADATAVGWAPVFSDEARAGWLLYTRAVASHYAERVKHWEIWNEPNISGFWKPQNPSAADYVKLVQATAPVIRQHVPGAVIIGGALAGVPLPFLKACLEAGLGELVDKLSYHPYRPLPEKNYEQDVAAMTELLQKHTQGRVKLWQGENGCPSQKGGAGAMRQYDWNETRQAKWLLRRILGDLRLGIELTSYFLIVDLVGYRGSANYKGLLRGTDYTPKPAYFAYQNLCALFDAETRRSETPLQIGGADARTVCTAAFHRRGFPLHAYWSPADLLKDFAPQKVQATLALGSSEALRRPVLIEPLTGEIFSIEAESARAGKLVFNDLPLLDYPLLLTDLAATRAT